MMRALILLPIYIPPPFRPQILSFKPSSSSLFLTNCSKPYLTKFRQLAAINGENPEDSVFSDDDDVIENMDVYLNHLSLEYDSVWDTKPYWCQPWTIVLTGMTVVVFSWLWLHSIVITIGISCLISAWWYIFLYAYPKAYSTMIAERRKNVNSGVEDTFGFRNI